VSPQISAFTQVGSGTESQSGGGGSVVTWSDGTPTPSGANSQRGVFVPGAGNDFRLTLPADPVSRTLRLYVNVFAAQMAITAALSDGSAPAYTDNALVDTSDSFQNGPKAGVYTLIYSAATAGTVTGTATTDTATPVTATTTATATATTCAGSRRHPDLHAMLWRARYAQGKDDRAWRRGLIGPCVR